MATSGREHVESDNVVSSLYENKYLIQNISFRFHKCIKSLIIQWQHIIKRKCKDLKINCNALHVEVSELLTP